MLDSQQNYEEEQRYLQEELEKALELLEINISNVKRRITRKQSIVILPNLTESALSFDRVLTQLRMLERIKNNGS